MDDARARALLGVDPGAGADAVEAAFRARAWATHPDRGGSGAHFAELSEARRVLRGADRPPGPAPRPTAPRPTSRQEPPQWVTVAATTAASVAADLEVLGGVLGRRLRRWLVRHLEA